VEKDTAPVLWYVLVDSLLLRSCPFFVSHAFGGAALVPATRAGLDRSRGPRLATAQPGSRTGVPLIPT